MKKGCVFNNALKAKFNKIVCISTIMVLKERPIRTVTARLNRNWCEQNHTISRSTKYQYNLFNVLALALFQTRFLSDRNVTYCPARLPLSPHCWLESWQRLETD